MAKLQYPLIINSDPQFTALADLGKRLEKLPISQIMTQLIPLVPAVYLTLLAEKWSVTGYDGWLLAESEKAKRKLIAKAVELHRHKGTPWSLREIIRSLGFGEIQLQEGLSGARRNGTIARDGRYTHGERSKWAYYRVLLNQPITNDQATLLKQALQHFAPARCVLASLDYQSASLRHNGVAMRNGQFNRGTA